MNVRASFDAVALGAAALIGAYGAYLIAIGPILTFVVPGEAATVTRQPYIAGAVAVVAALLVWYGMAKGRNAITWSGALLAAIFSVAFVFSVGGILIPVVVILLLALAVRRVASIR